MSEVNENQAEDLFTYTESDITCAHEKCQKSMSRILDEPLKKMNRERIKI